VVAQRLVRLVCSYCKEPVAIDWNTLGQLGIPESTAHNMNFFQGKGCPACAKTGYLRRAGIFEFLTPTERIRAEIEKNTLSTAQLRDLAMQNGMTTLRQEAVRLLLSGVTTIEETIRVTK
jgi:type II secretory ATPase GspE/PulE/Tfp pilus assembly ATPase PilB-like protein